MNRDELKGKGQNLKGRVKQAAGSLSGNRKLESEGAADRAKGAVREGFGEARRHAGEAVEELGRKLKK